MNVTLWESRGGPELCHWDWDYAIAQVEDRPDYDAALLLGILRSGWIPSGNGHFIPAMRATCSAGSKVFYREQGGNEVDHAVEGAYLDGNFGRSMKHDQIVTDRWAWMSAPQLWTMDGDPSEHMLTLGFFQKKLLPLQPVDRWSGAILWRHDHDSMTRFTPSCLLDSIEVSFHSPRYLDVTFITHERSHRITIRAWSHTMTTPLTTPSGRKFQDHQDLLADAYVVVEENRVAEWERLLRKPQWRQTARLVTDMFGFEFGEKDAVIGTPGYPAYDAVPQMPTWFVHALSKIPDGALSPPAPSPRLADINW